MLRLVEIFERAKKSMVGGVPMNWTVRWAGADPIFEQEASAIHRYKLP
ncbi:MAG TPA: hypothetical protein V6C81_23965 [Planktothrix sp.]